MEIHSLENLQDEIGRCEEFLEIMQLTSDELERYFGRIRTDENEKFILFEYDTATIKHRILDDYILKTKEQINDLLEWIEKLRGVSNV